MNPSNASHNPEQVGEIEYDPNTIVRVELGEEVFAVTVVEAVNKALEAATLLIGRPNQPLEKVLKPQTKETKIAHLLTLALLSDSVALSTEELADEIDYTPKNLLRRLEEAYALTDGDEQNSYHILQTRYARLLRGDSSAADIVERKDNTMAEKISNEGQADIQNAQLGDSEAFIKIRNRYAETLESVINELFPNSKVLLSDVENLANKILLDVVMGDVPETYDDFNDHLKTELGRRLRKFKMIAETTLTINMIGFLKELKIAEQEFSDDTKNVTPNVDKQTTDAIIAGALIFMVRDIDTRRSEVEGVPISNAPLLMPKRKVEHGYEKLLRSHITSSWILREVGWLEFDLTQVPSRVITEFLALSYTQKPSNKMRREISRALSEAGYIPNV